MQYIKCTIAKSDYTDTHKVGERWFVHFNKTENDDETVTFIECVTTEEPDMEAIMADYAIYKEKIDAKELATGKDMKVAEIAAYDSSDAVNEFMYNGQKMWIDKATRVGLVNAANAAKAQGNENITVGMSGISVTLEVDTLIDMLYMLEMYALECYNVTLAHKNAVNALTTIDEVEAYNYKTGYPQKLSFGTSADTDTETE